MASTVGVAVELTGAPEMKAAVDGLFKGITDSANKMNAAMAGPATTSGALTQYFVSIKNATSATREHGSAVSALSGFYHILHPALSAAGIQIGEIRALSMAARLGFEGLAAAIALGVVYELGKFSDAIEVAKTKLSDLAKSRTQGETIFKEIEKDAKSLGVTFDSLEPAVASAIGALQKFQAENRTFKIVVPPGQDMPTIFGQGFDAARKAVVAFFEALRIGGAEESQAFALTKQFFDKLQENSKITPQLVLSLKDVPGAIGTIARAFGQGSLNVQEFAKWIGENPKTVDQLIAALIRLKPEIDTAFNAGVPDKFGTALNSVWTAAKNLTRDLAQSDIVLGFLEAEKNGLVIIQNEIIPAIRDAWNATIEFLRGGWVGWKDFMIGIFSGQDWALEVFGPLRPAMEAIINTLKSQWMSFLQFLKSNPPVPDITNPNSILGAGGGSSGIGGFASGGLFRGRGGTDNNIIAISDYEYILRPEAVRKYGVQLLDWINSLQMPVRGFASGGLVTPRLALAGGRLPSNNQRPFVLNIPGAGSFRGSIAAPDAVLESLSRASTFEQMTQGGRSPGWRR